VSVLKGASAFREHMHGVWDSLASDSKRVFATGKH
jgi:hypothetical protein